MNAAPIDTSNPAVRDYLSLIRLQVLTPLSLLINVATVLVCAVVVKPTIGGVANAYPTSISPKFWLIEIYVAAIWVGQIGYCFLLLLARKPETKRTAVKGVGLSLVFANWFMAIWAVAWVLNYFIIATIFQGLLVLFLLYANIVLLVYHSPSSSRPFDTGLIHAPIRCFLILPLSVLFPYSLFLALGLYNKPWGRSPDTGMAGLITVLTTNLLGLVVIVLRRDIVWCVAATWICVSLWTQRPKPAPIYITTILFTVLHPLSLISAYVYTWFFRERQIALPPDSEEPNGNLGYRANNGTGRREEPRPREVDAEELWG